MKLTQEKILFPSRESLSTIEECAKEVTPEEARLEEWHKAYISNHKLRIAVDLDIVKGNISRDSAILEFGSVPLLLTRALSKSKYNVTGCDIAPERYDSVIRKTGMKVVKCDIEAEKLPFEDNSFDAVIFNELFEHLRINLIFTMSEVFRVIKPNGILMLSTPNLKSLGGMKNFMLKNRAYSCSGNIYDEFRKLEVLGHMGHVREYTSTEIVEFLEKIGFSMHGYIYRGRYGSNFAQILIRAIPKLSPFITYVAVKTHKK